MARDLTEASIADGSILFVATDGSIATAEGIDRLVAATRANVAIVASIGAGAIEAANEASFGTASGVAHVHVGEHTEPPSRLTDALDPHQPVIDRIEDRADLGAVGQAINRHLSDHGVRSGRPVVIVNSLTEILRNNTTEHVFYFMHLLIGLVRSHGGVCLFIYDRQKHETHELATLAELVDGVAVEPGLEEANGFDLAMPQPSVGDRAVNSLVAYSPVLWILAVLTFGMTDIVTTYIGLASGVAYEASPLAALIFEDNRFGYIYVAKGAVFVLFYLIWRFVPTPYNVSVPLGLTILGTSITLWNSYVIATGFL